MICDKCGKFFEAGNRPDGLPNGIGMECEDGRILILCSDCIMSLSDEKNLEWLERWNSNEER